VIRDNDPGVLATNEVAQSILRLKFITIRLLSKHQKRSLLLSDRFCQLSACFLTYLLRRVYIYPALSTTGPLGLPALFTWGARPS
jgi:hypothetical protein